MPLFRSVVVPLLLSAVLFTAGMAAWRLGKAASGPSTQARIGAHARVLAREAIDRELARLGSSVQGTAVSEEDLAAERQRLAGLLEPERVPGPRTPALTGVEERCESCHANSRVCGLSHPRELADALRRGESRERVRERFCTSDSRLEAIVSLVERLCAPQAGDSGDCEEPPELSDALDEAAEEYCGTRVRRMVCAEEGPEALLRNAADLLPPPGWARSHPGFGTLVGGRHPPETFGCAGCHDPETLSPEAHGENPSPPEGLRRGGPNRGVVLRSAIEDFMRFSRGELLGGGPAEDPQTRRLHALLTRCAGCHAPDAAPLPGAEALWEAHQLLGDLGCQGCHAVQGSGAERIGPPLRQLGRKLKAGYLVAWLRQPRALRPRTRMPTFWPEPISDAVREREARIIATWLLLDADGLQLADAPPGDAGRGATLFEEIGCLGCHELDSEGRRPLESTADRDFAPGLGDAGDRLRPGWTYLWLKDPQSWWPDARMPNLGLSDRDAADLTAFLMERRSGDEYPEALGTTAADAAAAPALVERYGCDGCHEVPGIARTKPIAARLSESAANLGQLGEHRTMDMGLSLAEGDKLALALRSLASPRFPEAHRAEVSRDAQREASGERLVRRYGCRNCHALGGRGGLILERYEGEDRAPFAPPPLDGLSARVRREWLAVYLQRPERMRPWIALRMPAFPFGADEAEALVHWFEAREPRAGAGPQEPPPPDPETLEEGLELVRALDCLGCHPASGSARGRAFEELGPDLALAKKRLRPDWIARWLADPQQVQPGTRMPSYFVSQPGGPRTTPAPHLLGGDPQRQIEALQQLLVHGAARGE